MQAVNLSLSGRGRQSLAPASGTDLVRLSDLQAVASGCAPLVHVHTSAAITDFTAEVLAILTGNGVALSGTGTVTLYPGGGLKYIGSALAADSGVVSFVGHQHVAADIADLGAALAALLPANISGSDSIAVTGAGPVTLSARLIPSGGLLVTAAGLGVDSGVVSMVGHTHSQLHDPLTLGASSTISGTLSNQQLTLEVRLVPGGGLLATPSGVAVDFAVVGRAGASGTGTSLTVANTPTLQLSYVGGILSGVVPLDANPPGGTGGKLIAGANGLRVVLGTDNQSAAPGDHGHAVATTLVDGFMSSADKAKLDNLAPGSGIPISASYTRESYLVNGEYLMGFYEWSGAVSLTRASFISRAPQSGTVTVAIEVNGSVIAPALVLPSGTVGSWVSGTVALATAVPAGGRVRCKITGAPAVLGNSAYQCQVNLRALG